MTSSGHAIDSHAANVDGILDESIQTSLRIFDKIVADVKKQERQRIRHALELAIEAGDYYEPEHDVVAFGLPLLTEIIGDV